MAVIRLDQGQVDKGKTMHSADDVDFVIYMKKRPLILKATKFQGLFGGGYRQYMNTNALLSPSTLHLRITRSTPGTNHM